MPSERANAILPQSCVSFISGKAGERENPNRSDLLSPSNKRQQEWLYVNSSCSSEAFTQINDFTQYFPYELELPKENDSCAWFQSGHMTSKDASSCRGMRQTHRGGLPGCDAWFRRSSSPGLHKIQRNQDAFQEVRLQAIPAWTTMIAAVAMAIFASGAIASPAPSVEPASMARATHPITGFSFMNPRLSARGPDATYRDCRRQVRRAAGLIPGKRMRLPRAYSQLIDRCVSNGGVYG
jgi:hypothetical protein